LSNSMGNIFFIKSASIASKTQHNKNVHAFL